MIVVGDVAPEIVIPYSSKEIKNRVRCELRESYVMPFATVSDLEKDPFEVSILVLTPFYPLGFAIPDQSFLFVLELLVIDVTPYSSRRSFFYHTTHSTNLH